MKERNDPPMIQGKPAIWDDDTPLLDAFSQWLCPVCNANLWDLYPKVTTPPGGLARSDPVRGS